MLKILIVEDNQDKLRRVLNGLTAVHGCTLNNIDIARDAQEAKNSLRGHSYDLMILDISIPTTSDLDPTPNGGLVLLDEINERDIYNMPREVIGLTAFCEIKEIASEKFNNDLWSILQYNITSNDWLQQIQNKLNHIISSKQLNDVDLPFETDICIITALYQPELSAVLNIPWQWKEHSIKDDPTQYHKGHTNSIEKPLTIIAASAPRMGMPAAAVLAMKMIKTFRPHYLIMAGITAGIRGKVELGDIIAADPSWDYGNGKKSLKDNVAIFSAAPHQINLDPFIRSKLLRLSQDSNKLKSIKDTWPTKAPPLLSLHIGPLASGAAVLEDPNVTESIQDQHRKVLGVEMEAYGVFAAAQDAPHPQPTVLVLKSVCDFADLEKNDNSQDYAAYTSAATLKIFVEQYL